MPRARDPNRDKAFTIYQDANGKIDLVEIASQLNLSAGTIRGWKSKDKWEERLKGMFQTKGKKCSKRSKGGQIGNKNAVGHGGTGPPGNKNAVKTGEFEALFFDTLEAEEQKLIQAMPTNKMQLLIQEIQLLTVREHRMLKRIEAIKGSIEFSENKEVEGMTLVRLQTGIEKGKDTYLKEYQGKLGQIQSIEEALTRVQARKQKAIDSLHRFGYDDTILEAEIKQKSSEDDLVEDWIASVIEESDIR